MLTTQTNIAIQIVATLSKEELSAFKKVFEEKFNAEKIEKQSKKLNLPSTYELAAQALEDHRKSKQYQAARKLA